VGTNALQSPLRSARQSRARVRGQMVGTASINFLWTSRLRTTDDGRLLLLPHLFRQARLMYNEHLTSKLMCRTFAIEYKSRLYPLRHNGTVPTPCFVTHFMDYGFLFYYGLNIHKLPIANKKRNLIRKWKQEWSRTSKSFVAYVLVSVHLKASIIGKIRWKFSG